MRVALAAGLTCLLGAAGTCFGQYLELVADSWGHPISSARPSIRLMGLGGLALVIPDEDNEINLSDFGGNVAGIARDKDTWSMESWVGRDLDQTNNDPIGSTVPVNGVSHFLAAKGAYDLVYRKPARRAVGVRGTWNGYSAAFGPTSSASVRGPNIGGFYNEILGKLSLGLGVSRETDHEDLVSPDVFSIRHSSRTWRVSAGGAYSWSDWDLGGQLEIDRVNIDGQSRDPSEFLLDQFTWVRPATRVRLSLIRSQAAKLQAGLNLSWFHLTGNEDVDISWSDRFPGNPSRANFRARVPTFAEKETGWDVLGRGFYPVREKWNLGGVAQISGGDRKVDESPLSNFPGSLSAVHSSSFSYRFGAGTGFKLINDRLQLGGEVYLWQGKVKSTYPRDASEVRSRQTEVRLGGEWFLPNHLIVRGGFRRGANDVNLDLDQSLYFRNGFAFGFGYAPGGGTISLDAALQVQREDPDKKGGSQRDTDVQNLAVSARFLF